MTRLVGKRVPVTRASRGSGTLVCRFGDEWATVPVNDVGLLVEEVDATTGELIGNFPQAFSDIGLVNAAWAIAQVEAGATTRQEVQDA